jgi:hypothetical protein
MPLKPSGQTPTSSPPRSIRSASSLQARVAPPLRASSPTTGQLEDQVGAERAQVATGVVVDGDPGHQPVQGHRARVVGDDQRAAVRREVLDAPDLDPEPLLRDRPERVRKKRCVISGSKPNSSTV